MAYRPYRYMVNAKPRDDGQLSIVRIERAWKGPDWIVLSSGEEVFSIWERLTTQAEWLCQQQVAIHPRLWMTPQGTEVVRWQPLSDRVPSPEVF